MLVAQWEPDTFVQIRDVDRGRRALRHAGGAGVDLASRGNG